MEKATTPLFVWHPPYYLLPTWKRKNKKGAATATASNIKPNLNMEAITSQHRKEEEEEKNKISSLRRMGRENARLSF
jgi:hypothetical protein